MPPAAYVEDGVRQLFPSQHAGEDLGKGTISSVWLPLLFLDNFVFVIISYKTLFGIVSLAAFYLDPALSELSHLFGQEEMKELSNFTNQMWYLH